jgi:hypothetical protein
MCPGVRWVSPILLSIAFAVQIVAGTAQQEPARLSPWLETALRQARDGERQIVWIYFRDKGAASRLRPATAPLSTRAAARRAARGSVTAATLHEDLPLEHRLSLLKTPIGRGLRGVALRWTFLHPRTCCMNAVSDSHSNEPSEETGGNWMHGCRSHWR